MATNVSENRYGFATPGNDSSLEKPCTANLVKPMRGDPTDFAGVVSRCVWGGKKVALLSMKVSLTVMSRQREKGAG